MRETQRRYASCSINSVLQNVFADQMLIPNSSSVLRIKKQSVKKRVFTRRMSTRILIVTMLMAIAIAVRQILNLWAATVFFARASWQGQDIKSGNKKTNG